MPDKERLERIIQMQFDGYTIWDMAEDDLVWLVEQAGRVQELEQQNERYREYLELIRKTGVQGRIISTGEIIRSNEAFLKKHWRVENDE